MVPVAEPDTVEANATLKGEFPELGLADKVAERDAAPTFTVTLSGIDVPPGPVQVKVYVWEEIRLPVDSEPLVPFEPDQKPEAVQEVALAEVQDKVTGILKEIETGPSEPLALRSTIGAAEPTATITLSGEEVPPGPVQIKV